MTTWYISPTGSDSTGNGSSGNPWATINKAHASASGGDTIVCMNGTYTHANNFGQTFTKALTIQAQNVGMAVFDGGSSYTIKGWHNQSILSVVGIKFYRLGDKIAGLPFPVFDIGMSGVTQTSSYTNCIFDDIVAHAAAGYNGGFFGGTAFVSGNNAMNFINCRFSKVSAYIEGSNNTACLFKSNVPSTYNFRNCTFHLDTSAGGFPLVYMFSNISTVVLTFKNNIVSNNSGGVVTWNTGSGFGEGTSISYSDFYQITSSPSGTGVITSDPLFVDAANGNLNLRPTSLCIDTGTLL